VVVDNQDTRLREVVAALKVDGGLPVASSGGRHQNRGYRRSQNKGRKSHCGWAAAQAW